MVNSVKTMRHSRSTTIAANFQSFVISAASSSFLSLSVMILSSFRMSASSLWGPRQEPGSREPPLSSWCGWLRRYPAAACPELCKLAVWCLKSSSMSNTFAKRLLDDLSLSSNSRIAGSRLLGGGMSVLPLPEGRDILKMQGNQWRKTVFIWNKIRKKHWKLSETTSHVIKTVTPLSESSKNSTAL